MYDTGFLTKILLRLSRSSIYRIIELTGGWEGRIIRTEVYFNVLDGATVVLAIFTLNFTHPGLLLQPAPKVEVIPLGSMEHLSNGESV
jgi:hypothetical protein